MHFSLRISSFSLSLRPPALCVGKYISISLLFISEKKSKWYNNRNAWRGSTKRAKEKKRDQQNRTNRNITMKNGNFWQYYMNDYVLASNFEKRKITLQPKTKLNIVFDFFALCWWRFLFSFPNPREWDTIRRPIFSFNRMHCYCSVAFGQSINLIVFLKWPLKLYEALSDKEPVETHVFSSRHPSMYIMPIKYRDRNSCERVHIQTGWPDDVEKSAVRGGWKTMSKGNRTCKTWQKLTL